MEASRLSFYGRYGHNQIFFPGQSSSSAADHDCAVLECVKEGWQSVGRFSREPNGRLRFQGVVTFPTTGESGAQDLYIKFTDEDNCVLAGQYTPAGQEPRSVQFARVQNSSCPPWQELQAEAGALALDLDSNLIGKSRTFVHIGQNVVTKELERGELGRTLRAVVLGAPVVEPWGIVFVTYDGNPTPALVEPKFSTLSKFYDLCKTDESKRPVAKASFDKMVKSLRAANCGGDFKLANVLEEPGSGRLVVTDLNAEPWDSWWEKKVIPEANDTGVQPEMYLDFDWRLKTMDA